MHVILYGMAKGKKCGKVCYPSQATALEAARKIPPNAAGLIQTGAYRCGKCKAWHLTSSVRTIRPRWRVAK